MESVAGLVRAQAASKGLQFQILIADDVPGRIVGDPLRLYQILLSLLTNAVKFTEAGRVRLEVALTCPGDEQGLEFRVTDTGIGIDSHMLSHLFTPFTQADSGSTRRYEGAGLGLATVRRLVQLMHGSIGVQSQPGRGSTFWFLIPVVMAAPPRETDAASPQPAPTGSSRGRILIVDDNPINQVVAQRAVERLGYGTELASSGEEAIAIFDSAARRLARFDGILLDCQMPRMDGYQTATRIRRRENGGLRVPIIALTANNNAEDREKCLACGMDDYLGKPLQLAALQVAFDRWVVNGSGQIPGGRASSPPAGPTPPGPPSGRSPTPLRGPPLPS